jgi:hypothetical protein
MGTTYNVLRMLATANVLVAEHEEINSDAPSRSPRVLYRPAESEPAAGFMAHLQAPDACRLEAGSHDQMSAVAVG